MSNGDIAATRDTSEGLALGRTHGSRTLLSKRSPFAFRAVIVAGMAAASLLAVGCGRKTEEPGSRPLVVEGVELSKEETASFGLVALVVDPARTDRRGICTGTLVTPTKVLTAAHCLASPFGALRFAVFGIDAFANDSVRVAIASTERQRTADIAVVTLAAPAPSSWRLQEPLVELKSGAANAAAVAAGFGRAGTDAPLTGGFARKVSTRMTSLEPGMPLVIANSGTGRGLCFGDSGGPLFANVGGRPFVVGVLSQGATTCETGLDTYTSVPFHGAWVKGAIGR